MRLTEKEAHHLATFVETLGTASGKLLAQFNNLNTELEKGVDSYDGEDDREHIQLFQDEIQELGFTIQDTILEWRCRLGSFTDRFNFSPPKNLGSYLASWWYRDVGEAIDEPAYERFMAWMACPKVVKTDKAGGWQLYSLDDFLSDMEDLQDIGLLHKRNAG